LRTIVARSLVFLLVALPLGSCVSAGPIVYSRDLPTGLSLTPYVTTSHATATASDRHVIVISIDGLRPDAIDQFNAPTLQKLVREGRYSLNAKTILPSITLPSHTSMITGVGPEVHGITWNDNQVEARGRVQVPTMLATAHEYGLQTAAIVSKGKFNHLLTPGAMDYFMVPAGNGSWSASSTADRVEDYLEGHRPNLLFVHIREPDRYGHIFGWMGRFYGWAVRQSDEAVEDILESADKAFGADGYTVIVTADHGGHGREHGSDDLDSVTIPWIAWGRGVGSAAQLPEGIRTFDTAATALWLLGVPVPQSYAGAPVLGAFDTLSVQAGAVAR
jgi:arylsulfatase A-like enzyme